MEWIDNCCPSCISNCLRVCCVYVSKKIGKKKKSYQGLDELQEQQFRFKEKGQRKGFKEQNQSSLKESNIRKISEQIIQGQKDKVKPQEFRQKIMTLNQQLDNTQLLNLREQQEEEKINNQEDKQQNLVLKDYQIFKINIDPFSPYYSVIQQRIKSPQNMKELLQIKGAFVNLGQGIHNVKIYQKNDDLKFWISYKLPCSYSFYSKINNNKQLKDLGTLIQEDLLLQTVQPNLKINYLTIGKFMILQPRQFTYLKYIYGSDNKNWQVCVTIPSKQPSGNMKGKQKIAGQFFSLTYIVQNNDNSKGVTINFNTYIEFDLKSAIKNPKFIIRGLTEVKNYIDKLYTYCGSSFQEELV